MKRREIPRSTAVGMVHGANTKWRRLFILFPSLKILHMRTTAEGEHAQPQHRLFSEKPFVEICLLICES